jgi:hypothetical protein
MKKFIFIIIATLIISPKNVSAQNNNAAGIATAVGGLMAIGAAIATIENMKERAELVATEFILTNNPELQNFSLKTLDFDGKKLKDMSSVSVISYKIQEFIPSDNPKLNGKKQVLFGFTSYGWITEQGIDFSRVTWILIDKEEWMNMMTAYAKVSSSQKNESVIRQSISNGIIVNKGVKVKNDLVIPFYKLEGDMYLTMDYSPLMKFIYNERSLGIFFKNTSDLVQIGRDDLIRIHDFFMDK